MPLATDFPTDGNGNFWPMPGTPLPKGFLWDGTTLWFREKNGELKAAPKDFQWSRSGVLLFFTGEKNYVITDEALADAKSAIEKDEDDVPMLSPFFFMIMAALFYGALSFFQGWISILPNMYFDEVSFVHAILSIILAAIVNSVVAGLWIWKRQKKETQKNAEHLKNSEFSSHITQKEITPQDIMSGRLYPHAITRKEMTISFSVLTGLSCAAMILFFIQEHNTLLGFSIFGCLFSFGALIFSLRAGRGSGFGETVPVHRPYGHKLTPPSSDDFTAHEASVQGRMPPHIQDALRLRQQIWQAYPHLQGLLKAQYQDSLAQTSPKERTDGRWLRKAVTRLFNLDAIGGKTRFVLESFLIVMVGGAVVWFIGDYYRGWQDRFPTRTDSLAFVQMMISEAPKGHAQQDGATKLYPRWRDPIVIRIKGEEGQKIFKTLDDDLEKLRYLTGLSIRFAEGQEPGNLIIEYKGRLERKIKDKPVLSEEENSSFAWHSLETTEDKRFIRKAFIEIDFDLLNVNLGDSLKISKRREIASVLSLWGVVACLGLLSDPPEEIESILTSSDHITPLDGLSLYVLYDPNLPAAASYTVVADKIAARIDQALKHERLDTLIQWIAEPSSGTETNVSRF